MKIVSWLSFLFIATTVWGTGGDCAYSLHTLVEEVQRSVVGRAKVRLPHEIDVQAPGEGPATWLGAVALEKAAFDLLFIPPSLRGPARKKLADTFNVPESSIRDIELFFTVPYFNVPELYSDLPNEVKNLITELERAYPLIDPDSRMARRYLAYLGNVTRLSGPEIAKILKLTEQQVYYELSILGISIEEEFSRPVYFPNKLRAELEEQSLSHLVQSGSTVLSLTEALLHEGMPVKQIAQKLGVGEQALHFILHYRHEKNRGVPWDRNLIVSDAEGRQKVIKEEDYLKEQYRAGVSTSNIAHSINLLTRTNEGQPDFRTQASVSAKLQRLFPSPPPPVYPEDVLDPTQIGVYLKFKGVIQENNLTDYLLRHLSTPIAWIAEDLEISPKTLADFAVRNNIPLGRRTFKHTAAPSFSTSNKGVIDPKALLQGYEEAWVQHKKDTFAEFMDREKGALKAFDTVEGFARTTSDALLNLAPHLTDPSLKEKVSARITNKQAGMAARQQGKHGQQAAAQQIQDAFYWICEAHNQWVDKGNTGDKIDLAKIHSLDGARKALFALRHRITDLHPETTEAFLHPKTGGLKAFDTVERFSSDVAKVLLDLAPHLTELSLKEKVSARITNNSAGVSARLQGGSGQQGAAQQIQDVFYWICEAHNQWVDAGNTGDKIDLAEIHSLDGARKALFALRHRITDLYPERTELFLHPETGGLKAFDTVERFSSAVAKALLDLAPHLTDPSLKEKVSARITNKQAGKSARLQGDPGQQSAAQQIQDAFYWICEAHNLRVTQNKEGPLIKLETLDTKDGAKNAIEALRASSTLKNPS
jgi:hypothetical protein